MTDHRACIRVAIIMLCCACQRAQDRAKPVASADSLSLDSLRCAAEGPAKSCAIYAVSLYELIAKPVEYHGKRVRVLGFAHFEFEGNGLYAHRDDYEQGLTKNGIWLAASNALADSTQDKYVLAEGTFNAIMRGHFGMWSGSLLEVTRLDTVGKLIIPPMESIPRIDLTSPRR
jgi:hypothetical protein